MTYSCHLPNARINLDMKIDRLIGILSILIQKERASATELAQMFEVSKRTINRDIDSLLKAGIPIITSQGYGGGISIADGYRMDKTILSYKDMQMIIAGLRSLDSVSDNRYFSKLMEKIKVGSKDFVSGSDSILIDLSSWNKDSLSPKIEIIQEAIELSKLIRFEYYSPKGNSIREIEPYYLIFKWSSWYVYGYCLLRNDFRLFKLNRITNITTTKDFQKRTDVPLPDLSIEKVFPSKGKVRVVFDSSMKWHLIEDYGIDSFKEMADGKLLFEHDYSSDKELLTWLLVNGDKVNVLEPENIKEKIVAVAKELIKKYEQV